MFIEVKECINPSALLTSLTRAQARKRFTSGQLVLRDYLMHEFDLIFVLVSLCSMWRLVLSLANGDTGKGTFTLLSFSLLVEYFKF